ncbi:MAG: hypothetical protein CMN85_09175 [Spongiibacteraceae bacterium]|nr:hypothetical protein [Spongiibacteraceae bacterium]|tara:strand:- start:3346 stop:3786 length:441 start_codon:yes stop_codon:yes gene_type:complete
MQNQAVEVAKKLASHGKACVTNPENIFLDKTSQSYEELVAERTSFIDFHEHMFSLSDDEVRHLNDAFRRFWREEKKMGESDSYIDVLLLQDAIHYQLAIRSEDGFTVGSVSEEIANSWLNYVELSMPFPELTSDTLISLSTRLEKH